MIRLRRRLNIPLIKPACLHLLDALLRHGRIPLSARTVAAERVDEAVELAADRFARAVEFAPCLWKRIVSVCVVRDMSVIGMVLVVVVTDL